MDVDFQKIISKAKLEVLKDYIGAINQEIDSRKKAAKIQRFLITITQPIWKQAYCWVLWKEGNTMFSIRQQTMIPRIEVEAIIYQWKKTIGGNYMDLDEMKTLVKELERLEKIETRLSEKLVDVRKDKKAAETKLINVCGQK